MSRGHDKPCEWCGTTMLDASPIGDRRWCSTSCRQKAYRERCNAAGNQARGKSSGLLCQCGCGEETRQYGSRVCRFVRDHYSVWLSGRHAGHIVEDRGHETPCWIWQGGKQNQGYGRMSVDRRNVPAHRAYYEQHVGPIPEGLQLDHLCKVPSCVNPGHLEPVTPRENRRRSSRTLLTREQVVVIKRELAPHLSGRVPNGMYDALAARYGVAKGTIRSIRKGGSWTDVIV